MPTRIAAGPKRGYKRAVRPLPRQSTLLAAGAAVLLFTGSAGAQTRPLRTEPATTAPAGQLELETGIEAIAAEPSFVSGVERTRWDGPLLRLVYSPADRVELDLEWVTLVGAGAAGGDPAVTDFGDVTLRAKLRIVEGRDSRPTVGARFGVTLPETSYEDEEFRPLGLGPNVLRAFAEALLTQPVGPVWIDLNAGLYLHDEVSRPHDQLDFLSYGLAARWRIRPRLDVVAEVAGRAGKGKPGAAEQSELRAGVRFSRGRLAFDAALRRGLAGGQGTWGGTLGLTWTIRSGT